MALKGIGGTGSTTVSDASVTNAKLANAAALTLKGNNTGGSATPADLTADQVQAMLDFVKAFSTTETGGTDGDVGVRTDLGGILRARSGGSWTDVAAPTATGAQLYDGTYPAADHTDRARFVTTWGLWTINEWFVSNGTIWYPESRVLRLLDPAEPAGSTSASNVVTKTVAFPANLGNGARRLILSQEFTATGTAGTKSPRVWLGASAAGTGGTLIHAPAASATGSVHFYPLIIVNFEGNANQHFSSSAVTSNGSHAGGAVRATGTINVANAWELALGGSTSAGDTLSCSYSFIDIYWPSLKT
jgi:hypothetical protein